MKVLVFCQYYYPERFLLNEIAPELVKRGHEVTVITGMPNYPEGKIYHGYEKKFEEEINGVKVLRCNIVPRGNSKLQLLINYLSYMRKATRKSKRLKGDFDVVFLYQLTPIFQAYPAIKYAMRNNKKILCYCLDLAPSSGEDVVGKRSFFFTLYRKFSQWAYTNCDRVAVTSRGFVEYLRDVHGIPETKMRYLPQHASDVLLYANLEKIRVDDVTDFLFAGNIGFGARMDLVIEAAYLLKEEGLKFRINIVGNGSDKHRLIDLVREKELEEYVIFHDPVPMNEMDKVYRTADALIVTLRKDQVTIPSKVQAYMATGKPIFGAMDGSGQELIREANCGECCNAEDVQGIVKMLRGFIRNPLKYEAYGKNGRIYFSKCFTLKTYCDELEKLLLEMMC